jgi:hypothetical protein
MHRHPLSEPGFMRSKDFHDATGRALASTREGAGGWAALHSVVSMQELAICYMSRACASAFSRG